jgi:protein-S-isoprenylcysteine O-methyltransferase Ste14
MLKSLVITLPAVLFLIVLFGGGAAFRRRNIDMDGKAPIGKPFFYGSKYAIVLVWAAMVARSWGADFAVIRGPAALKWLALLLWLGGFALLFAGRVGLGEAFRIGRPSESTSLKVDGLFRLSRNPMYVGVYATLLASVLYTLNPVVLLVAVFIVAVHHQIVLAEEQHLAVCFGSAYADYRGRVRRYL